MNECVVIELITHDKQVRYRHATIQACSLKSQTVLPLRMLL